MAEMHDTTEEYLESILVAIAIGAFLWSASPWLVKAKIVSAGFLVDVERTDLDALRKAHPDAFARPYDKATGPAWERILA